ncbi:5954_t:CDS:2 [Ambispora gerdemannii]|uniref:5954_t:CDS:1 n=1 Tax=Ambispora gerdemannii TaxID=144530 RepID=A0A9N8YNC3_9GLOM|nr:5954_t:CDS:2 [Ambispora gerdemannii]
MPQVYEDGSTSVEGGIDISYHPPNYTGKNPREIGKKNIFEEGKGIRLLSTNYVIHKVNSTIQKLEGGFEIEGGLYRRNVGVKLEKIILRKYREGDDDFEKRKQELEKSEPIQISLFGTQEAMKLVQEKDLLGKKEQYQALTDQIKKQMEAEQKITVDFENSDLLGEEVKQLYHNDQSTEERCDQCNQIITGKSYYADAKNKTGTSCERCIDKKVRDAQKGKKQKDFDDFMSDYQKNPSDNSKNTENDSAPEKRIPKVPKKPHDSEKNPESEQEEETDKELEDYEQQKEDDFLIFKGTLEPNGENDQERFYRCKLKLQKKKEEEKVESSSSGIGIAIFLIIVFVIIGLIAASGGFK